MPTTLYDKNRFIFFIHKIGRVKILNIFKFTAKLLFELSIYFDCVSHPQSQQVHI